MKRLGIGLAVAALTFVVGAGAGLVWLAREPASIPAPVESEALPVEHLELRLAPGRYAGRLIRLRVFMPVDWKGALMRGHMSDPRNHWEPPFFGFDYAPGSEKSFAAAEAVFGVDPDDAGGEHNLVRGAHVTLEGEFVVDREKTDRAGRTYPYWFIVRRLDGVGAGRRAFVSGR